MAAVVPRAMRELLAPLPPETRALVLAVRTVVLATLPGVQEMPDRTSRVVGYGYSPKYKDTVATIILSRSGAKLGIVGGASLDDPDRILEGKGKVHRHIAFTDTSQVKRPAVKAMLKRALARLELP